MCQTIRPSSALNPAESIDAEGARVSQQELDMLTSFFASDEVPADTMDLQELDGFLTAIASAPSVLMPSMWLPALYGDDEAFADGEGARTSNAVVARLLNEISDALQRVRLSVRLDNPNPPMRRNGRVAMWPERASTHGGAMTIWARRSFPFGVLSGLFTLSPEDMEAAQRERDAEDAKAEEIVAAPATRRRAPRPRMCLCPITTSSTKQRLLCTATGDATASDSQVPGVVVSRRFTSRVSVAAGCVLALLWTGASADTTPSFPSSRRHLSTDSYEGQHVRIRIEQCLCLAKASNCPRRKFLVRSSSIRSKRHPDGRLQRWAEGGGALCGEVCLRDELAVPLRNPDGDRLPSRRNERHLQRGREWRIDQRRMAHRDGRTLRVVRQTDPPRRHFARARC